MTISASDMEIYKATVNNDTTTNGNVMSANVSVTNTFGNLFPSVTVAERASGLTRYRKAFFKLENATTDIGNNPKIFVDEYTPGADALYIFAGTQIDTQADISSPDLFGNGQLDSDVSAAVSTFDVAVEDGTNIIFRDGETIRISDKSIVTDAGNEEYHTINGTPVVAGDVVTIIIDGTLSNAYVATATRVSSVIEPSDIDTLADTYVVTSAGTGDFDYTTYPITLVNIPTVEDDWTVTFTTASDFGVVGARSGNMGAGNTSTDFTPNNADFSDEYFTLDATGWSGTWASGDTFTFSTHPSSSPIWAKQMIPAASAAYSSNNAKLAFVVES